MSFTREEWDACIKVLQVLSRDPNAGLDTEIIKGLVTKIYKRAKKEIRGKSDDRGINEKPLKTEIKNREDARKTSSRQSQLRQSDMDLKTNTLLFQRHIGNKGLGDTPLFAGGEKEKQYHSKQTCYQCKDKFNQLHFFYPKHCPTCATFNFEKRSLSCDLSGRIALITGGRIKIGYETALRLLRDGAKVWVTTRFTHDCAKRFSEEADFKAWADRLQIVPLDLRSLRDVQDFIQMFEQNEPHLDILINNAAQTIKRPQEFYQHLFDYEQKERDELPEAMQKLLPLDIPFKFLSSLEEQKLLPFEHDAMFPRGLYDKDNQQVDLRQKNSWKLLLHEVSVLEMLETQLVNMTAPFMLNSTLKAMMMRSPHSRKFIINVSAMEGQFNRESKTAFHPHTNMAKAALNMMTRTSAIDYATDGIFMNSVDTGWITQENPHPIKERLFNEEYFVPPLDEIDGMARIFHPIFEGITKPEVPIFGHFLKDFKPYFW